MNKHDPIVVEAYVVPDDVTMTSCSAPPQPIQEGLNEEAIRNYLSTFQWPSGLVDCLIQNVKKMQLRYFICDDSGSMTYSGGQILAKGQGTNRMMACSRWTELTQSVQFHAELANVGCIPTEFRMLNRGDPVLIGDTYNTSQAAFERFRAYLQDSPTSGTPLCRHIRDIVQKVTAQQRELRAAGQMACVIIATDGEASDGDLIEAMRPLKSLPVWIVVRLCTNESAVVDYWTAIDKQLELNMEVLDDFQGEAQEIHKYNPWLTYGEPLHRLREFGVHIKEVDFLDEQKLAWEQIRTICHIIFGGNLSDFPHPELDYQAFKAHIDRCNHNAEKVFSPVGPTAPRPWMTLRHNSAPSTQHNSSGVCLIS